MSEWRHYVCEYPFGRDGAHWGITIPARSPAEAADRLKAIGAYGEVSGELHAVIPASRIGAGLYVRAVTWWRNRFRSPAGGR